MSDLDILFRYCSKCKHRERCYRICPTVWLALMEDERNRR